VSANNEHYSPLEATPEMQPQLQPALLRLSAMLSQLLNATDSVGARPFVISVFYSQKLNVQLPAVIKIFDS
jgi:hypothetical protein